MHKNYRFQKLPLLIFLPLFGTVQSQTLVHYWNFNDNASVAAITKTSHSAVAGASLKAVPGGISTISPKDGTGQNFNVENLNARNGDPAGTHLRFNDPIGGALEFALPTTGYQNVVVKFSTRRSGSGAGTQTWSYSADGSTYTTFATINPVDGNPTLEKLDFSNIPSVSNNPNFKLKVEFTQGSGGTVGNNRFDNFTVDAELMSATDTTPPAVAYIPANAATKIATTVTPEITFNENVRLTDNSALTAENAVSLVEFRETNASGNAVAFSATVTANSIKIVPASPLKVNQTYYLALKPNTIEDFSDNAVTAATSSVFTTAGTSVSLAKTFIKVDENVGTLNFAVNVNSPSDASIDLVVKPAPFSTADSKDFTFATQTVNITPNTPSVLNFSIPIIDDTEKEQHSEYFVLSLENPVGTTVTGGDLATVYIVDNDNPAPVPSKQIELNYIGSFDPSGSSKSTTEIVAHDPVSKRLFTTSAITNVLDIIDFSNPASLSVIKSISMEPYGGLTSVAVKNGLVAVASPNKNPQQDGSVVFFDTDGNFKKQVTVGALPDMVTFSPDGKKIMTANEGEPNADYSVDPEGSVSIIDISGGIAGLTQAHVKTLLFTDYNAQEGALLASGIRKLKASSTLSQDFEPEYIAISEDNKKAWVTIQENNAVAEINLETKSITNIWPLGKKDMSIPGNGFDASDNNGEILIANWPVKSYLIPDAVQTYNVGGVNYIITANEGDEKEFSNLNERTTVGANDYMLDQTAFPQAAMLKQSHNLGRFRVTNVNGNTDGDSEYEEINSLGARSFSIFNADTQQIVFDSGDQIERYIAANWAPIFNSDHESNSPKNRSRSKGPEPEGVTLGSFGGETFAFVSLERTGGVMVYNVTDPRNPVFVDYKNTRSTSAYGGDNGAEGILYIPSETSGTGKSYVIVANEISGTLTVYEVDKKTLAANESKNEVKTFTVFPNPAPKGTVYFNREADYQLFDMSGKLIRQDKKAKTIDANNLSTGVYFIKTSEGISRKLIVK